MICARAYPMRYWRLQLLMQLGRPLQLLQLLHLLHIHLCKRVMVT